MAKYTTQCAEIIALFVAAGREVPDENSDMGKAIQILQTICDNQSHDIPDFEQQFTELEFPLHQMGWNFFHGNATCNPYAENKNAGCHIEANSVFELRVKVIRQVNPSHDIFEEIESSAFHIFEALEEIENHIGDGDFTLDFDGNEYRIISDSEIWDIYVEEIKDLVEDCYSDVINLDKIPSFIAVTIDWEQTAKNAYVDGYGHHFSSYDGSEEEVAGYYIFRIN